MFILEHTPFQAAQKEADCPHRNHTTYLCRDHGLWSLVQINFSPCSIHRVTASTLNIVLTFGSIISVIVNKAQASFENNNVMFSFITLGSKTSSQCGCVLEDNSIRHFSKSQACLFPQTSDIRRNTVQKFTELSTKTPCWCTSLVHQYSGGIDVNCSMHFSWWRAEKKAETALRSIQQLSLIHLIKAVWIATSRHS